MNAAVVAPEAAKRAPRPWLSWCIDLLLVVAFVAAIYPGLVFTGRTLVTDGLWSDLLTLAQPTYSYTGQELARGHLPLWNPYWFAGFPHLAMPSASVFYPTTILFGVLGFASAVKIVVLLHCYLSGAFSYALIRSALGRRLPALYFAFSVIAGDFVLPWVRGGSLWTLQTLAWFPVAVLFIHRLCDKARLGSVAGLACTVAMMVFGGDTQSLAFCLWFLAPYVLVLLVVRWWTGAAREAIFSGTACLAGVVLGFGLAAIQLLPSRELFAESIRASGVSIHHMRFEEDSASRVFTSFLTGKDENFWRIVATNRLLVTLAIVGLVFSRHRLAWAAAMATLPCLLYALIPQWFYDWVVIHLPVFNGVRGTFRVLTMVWWTLAYLSASGVATLTSPVAMEGRARVAVAGVALAALVVLVSSSVLAHVQIPPMRVAACLAAALGAILIFVLRKKPARWLVGAALIVAAAVTESEWRVYSMHPYGDPAPYTVDAEVHTFASTRGDMDRVMLLYNWLGYRHGAAVALLERFRELRGYHGLMLNRWARLFRDVAEVPIALNDANGRLDDSGEFRTELITEKMLPVLNLLNVRHIISIDFRSELAERLSRRGGPFKQVRYGKYGRVRDFVNTHALPPMFPVHETVACASDREALALMHDGRIDVRRQLTLTGETENLVVRPALGPESMDVLAYETERISVQANMTSPGILVFSEIFYPGWEATVDGEPREVLCVDTALRGVRVDEGEHEIVLRYRPASLVRGAIVSVSTAVLMIVVTLANQIRRRRARKVTATLV